MSVVGFESKTQKAVGAKQRAVRGAEGSPKKGEPGYSPNYVDVPAVPEYVYQIAKVTPIEGDESGEKTFIEAFDTLAKGNYKNAVKYFVRGWNYFNKKNSAPKSDAKQLKALRTLAEASGLSIDELKSKLGI